jgi:hypothetical protein
MNERIRELYDQALETKFDYGGGVGIKPGEYYSNYITVLNPEKFAELIVRECANIANAGIDPNDNYLIGDDILEHFGVE